MFAEEVKVKTNTVEVELELTIKLKEGTLVSNVSLVDKLSSWGTVYIEWTKMTPINGSVFVVY